MRLRLLQSLFLFIPFQLLADTVVYTDAEHPPQNLTETASVVWLDGPDRLQDSIFGKLAADPQLAARQAREIFQSPQWDEQQEQIAQAYRQVVHAWEIGLHKFPAVVFEDRYVVYGTADVARAEMLRNRGGH
ncbi:TIGR03757 family integrating conjugative element protein (plasmid) [Erwinia pyri]|uniref:TIGR03757 family integrating conjugative element protein n=1 Tax=Erwinia pyri TaxID=3062598 RepID=A0AA50DNJ2_9GAMM|nr:TIGR03757 family integrating conjugative element protein [Erwinia sp. DE2]WLS81176.1 TIGR03757 family integrating conjugative element protein [Erwinia sp. DE2]